jgi:2-dehydro-3-deoxyphosphogluconate aldolase/(4S)-4-hydroxy-2-oxoglutarate aldolase
MKTTRNEIIQAMTDTGIVAVIRASAPDDLLALCEGLREGGVGFYEITMTTPGALGAIEQVAAKIESGFVGVGSVLDAETARLAILAGAKFVVSPILSPGVIEMSHRYGVPVICGALTPTEILNAWQAGADLVKVFPANHFGPTYFKDLLAPMPQLRLTPTGGVSLDTAEAWVKAGAACLGVGSSLVKPELVKNRDWDGLARLARQYVDIFRAAKASLGGAA